MFRPAVTRVEAWHRISQRLYSQVFLEPEGRDTPELYVQGFSTGLPERLQLALLRTLPGMYSPLLSSQIVFLDLLNQMRIVGFSM